MAVFGLVGLGLFGVIVLGARSAGSGERITEQARRYRIANEVISRQIAAIDPIQLPKQKKDDALGEDDENEDAAEPFFFGESDTLEFVTTAPQRPDASGMAIVRYWVEDGMLRMSERPVFTAYASTKKRKKLDHDIGDDTVETTLLYDVDSATFSYQRESDSDEWLDTWDAVEEEKLPACVRLDVKPSAAGGPDFYHEIPVMVAAYNQMADVDGDFRAYKSKPGQTDQNADDNAVTPPGNVQPPNDNGGEDSPGATQPDNSDDDSDE
jgi:hypothetical protein